MHGACNFQFYKMPIRMCSIIHKLQRALHAYKITSEVRWREQSGDHQLCDVIPGVPIEFNEEKAGCDCAPSMLGWLRRLGRFSPPLSLHFWW